MNRLTIRNISLAAILIALLAIIVSSTHRLPFGKRESQFAVSEKENITKIEFEGDSKKLILEKKAQGWILNGKHEARKSGINFILEVLADIRIKSPLSPDLFNALKKDEKKGPVHVKVFDRNRLLKSFYVYKTGTTIYGNVMQLRSNSKPFIINVPGFEGDIGSAFTLNELFWRPYTVFNRLPSEIETVTFENIADPSSSFTINCNRNVYTLSGPESQLTGWDTAQVKRYISYFTWIPFERWGLELTAEEIKTIVSTDPLFRITLKTTDASVTRLSMWEKSDSPGKKDTDRLWAKTDNNDELFVIRYFDIDPLLKKRSYFFSR